MAKYCMFCGKTLPDAAQFCPHCGKSQSVEEEPLKENNNEIEVEEESSDELDLLSQFGYMAPKQKKKSPPPFVPTKQPEKPAVKEPHVAQQPVRQAEPVKETIPTPTFTQEVQQPVIAEETVPEEEIKNNFVQTESPKQTVLQIEKPVTKIAERTEEAHTSEPASQPEQVSEPVHEPVETPLKANEDVVLPPPLQDEPVEQEVQPVDTTPHSSRRRRIRGSEEPAIPFQPTEQPKTENIIPTVSSSDEQYELPDNFDIDSDEDLVFQDVVYISEEEISNEEKEKEQQEREKLEREREERAQSGESEAISAKRKPRFFGRNKASQPSSKSTTTNDDDEEDFNTDIGERSSSSSMVSERTMYADEIQDEKRRKEAVVVDDDDDIDSGPVKERRRSGEGRKEGRNTSERRRSSRNDDINKKIYNIELDTSQLDPEEANYDGYYENVLPVDYGNQKKRKFDKKTALLILAGVAIVIVGVLIIMAVL